jgi:type I restriction enzyme S subunit
MNAEVLLEHFHRLGDAPDAVPRLRRFILDLAVGGKLATRTTAWEPTTLGELGEWGSGGTPNKAFQQYYGGDIPWLVIGDLNGGLVTSAETHITKAGLENSSAKMVEPGTVLIAMYGSIGKLGIAGIRCATNQAIAHCVPDERLVARDYLVVVLKSMQAALLSKGQGIAQQNISQKILKAHPLELPPLAEQHRIVAKVDELMALCDRLEAAQQQREQERTRLTAASWQALVTEGSTEAARFALEQLPALTTRPAQVKALRQTILDLAVRGKLVEQDPKDEPAEVLLKRIAQEKERLMRTGELRNREAIPEVDNDEVSYQLPTGWTWGRVGQLGLTQTGTTPSKNHGNHFGDHIPFVKPADLLPNEVVYDNEGLSSEGLAESGRIAPAGSILMVCIGTIGKCQVIRRPCSFNQQINSLTPYCGLVSEYLLTAFRASEFHASAWAASTTSTLSLLNKGKWEILYLPIPPLAEQGRIVAKVDALMKLCDRLEAALQEGEEVGGRLLEAVLARSEDQSPSRKGFGAQGMIRQSVVPDEARAEAGNGMRVVPVTQPKVARVVQPKVAAAPVRAYAEVGTELALAAEPGMVVKRGRGRPRKVSDAGAGSAEAAVLAYLQAHAGWHAKSAVLEATGVDAGGWNAAIKGLMVAGKVERMGAKKGARYKAIDH